jgi:hypothetical protein
MQLLHVFADPVVSLHHDSAICSGLSRILYAGSFEAFQWNTGSTAKDITIKDISIYSGKVTDANGCSEADAVLINIILPLPSGFLPPDTAVCSYENIQIGIKNKFCQYLWNTGWQARVLRQLHQTFTGCR